MLIFVSKIAKMQRKPNCTDHRYCNVSTIVQVLQAAKSTFNFTATTKLGVLAAEGWREAWQSSPKVTRSY